MHEILRKGITSSLNILLVTYSAYPRIGGRSTYMTLLKQKLEDIGHRVDLLAHQPGLNEIYIMGKQSVNKQDIRLSVEPQVLRRHQEAYPHLSPWIRWRETERYIFEEAIKRFDLTPYDLIHAQDIFSALACTRIHLRQPVVASFHNCKVAEWKVNQVDKHKSPQETAYIAREEYLSVLRPDRVIVPSDWLRASFEKLGLPDTKCTVIPYGIDITRFRSKMNRITNLEKPAGRFIILVPARLVPIKGHTFLFQALEQLKQENISFECWLAGNGVLEAHLREEAKERKVDDVVRFLGGREDVPALMALADMMVLPTLHDTFPFAVLEAQTAGLPVIASAVGGVVEMIEDGKTGLLVPPGNADLLYKAMAKMMLNSELKERISVNSRQFADRHWDVSLMAKRTLDVYQDVIGSFHRNTNAVSFPDGIINLDHDLLDSIPSDLSQSVLTGSIAGKVEVPADRSPADIQIHLMDISWITLQTTSPDPSGDYVFEEVPVGRYALMAVDGNQKIQGHTVVSAGQISIWNARFEGDF
jgi:glycosyltransferase involved in cell wall biosynthesis